MSGPVIDLAGVFPPEVDRDRFDPWIDRLTPGASVAQYPDFPLRIIIVQAKVSVTTNQPFCGFPVRMLHTHTVSDSSERTEIVRC